jgi:glycosyltransferase involved in cell wall biosynthesis
MDLDVIIPWGLDGNLGEAYNRAMRNCVKDWVCFLDHDILQLNPNWYRMTCDAIRRVGYKAGWITGTTNAIACTNQLQKDAPKDHDIASHMAFAKKIHNENGDKLIQVDPDDTTKQNCLQLFSGFMIVTHKKAWEKVGGFGQGFLGVDNKYCVDLKRSGFDLFVMSGLYMYHIYKEKARWSSM